MDKWYDYYVKASHYSYSHLRRLSSIEGVVIHNTDNVGDSAKNNMYFFSKKYGSNTRYAGAHIFIDQRGIVCMSVPLRRAANAVGNPDGCYAPGTYNSCLNNLNTISIELCDIMTKEPSEAMLESLFRVVEVLHKKCPNLKYVCRHYDIVRKDCPSRYVKNEKEWHKLRTQLTKIISE